MFEQPSGKPLISTVAVIESPDTFMLIVFVPWPETTSPAEVDHKYSSFKSLRLVSTEAVKVIVSPGPGTPDGPDMDILGQSVWAVKLQQKRNTKKKMNKLLFMI
jgi:anthranilate/para-aminobenzoate synthase component II